MAIWISTCIAVMSFLFLSCAKTKGVFFQAPSSFRQEPILVIAGGDVNHRALAYYSLNGELLGYITDYRDDSANPRGLALFDTNSFLVSLDAPDRIDRVYLDGTRELFHGNLNFAGVIYDIVRNSLGRYFTVETNNIEIMSSTGVRLGTISQVTGACSLSAPRGMFINENDVLIVTNQGGADEILRYDVSGDTPTCLSSNPIGNNPYGIIEHSNGSLYVAGAGDDQIYRTDGDGSNPTVIFATDWNVIRMPSAIVELPDGTMLVASQLTDSIVRIAEDGTHIGDEPFIQDAFSLNVNAMLIIPGEE